MKRHRAIAVALLFAAACSKSPDGSPAKMSSADASADAAGEDGKQTPIKVAVPQIAYTYRYSFRLPGQNIASAQARHIALCDQLGPARCMVLDMQRSIDEQSSGTGSLRLVVQASLARQFGARLVTAIKSDGGVQADSSIAAEDLSKQIVDTEARVRAKQALADRLMTLLQNRTGSVADLVSAERALADVQEEIDAARSWLAEARGRVSMSTFELSYASDGGLGSGFIEPLTRSLSVVTGVFGQSLSFLILLLASVLPWAALAAAVFAGWRAWRRRHLRKQESAEE